MYILTQAKVKKITSSRVQLRRAEAGPPETVNIELVGPQSILQGKKVHIINTPLDVKWLHLLNSRAVNLKITEGNGLYICTTEIPSIVDGKEWRSELDETVGEYIRKRLGKQNVYSVRLCYGGERNSNIETIDISGSDTEMQTADEQIHSVSNIKTEEVECSQISSNAGDINVAANLDSSNCDIEMPTLIWGDYNHEIDEDLKTMAERRLREFDEASLLRVKKEIENMKKKNVWEKNLDQCPLGSKLLSELFSDL